MVSQDTNGSEERLGVGLIEVVRPRLECRLELDLP